MANTKTILSAVVAIVLVVMVTVVTFGFKADIPKSGLTYATYHYTETSTLPVDENNPNNWALGTGSNNCDTGPVLCTISAPMGSAGKPDFTDVTSVRTSPIIEDLTTHK